MYKVKVIVLGQSECIQEKLLCSGKIIVFLQKMVEFEKTGKYFGKNGRIRAKWMYLGNSGCIQAKWLYSGKVMLFEKMVVFGQK